jgi:hypothetical protein
MTDGEQEYVPREGDAGGSQVPEVSGTTPEARLRSALLVYASVNGITGFLLLAFPRFIWHTVGGSPDLFDPAYASTRLTAGALLALAVGALLVIRDPRGQNTLVTVMVVEAVLVAVGGFWNVAVDESPTNLWFEIFVPSVSAAVAGYVGWARIKARRILRAD